MRRRTAAASAPGRAAAAMSETRAHATLLHQSAAFRSRRATSATPRHPRTLTRDI